MHHVDFGDVLFICFSPSVGFLTRTYRCLCDVLKMKKPHPRVVALDATCPVLAFPA